MDVSQQTVLQATSCLEHVNYRHIVEVLAGNAKSAYLAVITTCDVLGILITLQYGFLVFRHWKVPIEHRSGRGLAILTAYTIHALTRYHVSVVKQLGHITRFDFFYSLVPRIVLSIILPLCFIYPLLSIPEEQRPYRRVGVIPAVLIGCTLIFSSIVVVLDRGVTYGESRTLENLELAHACIIFFLHKRLRRVQFEGYWRALRASLFLMWLPPVQRLLIRWVPVTVPQSFVDAVCSAITISEVKDGLYATVVILEAMVFSSWFLMFSIRDKSVVTDTEAAEPVESDADTNEKVNLEVPESATENQNEAAQTVSKDTEASLI